MRLEKDQEGVMTKGNNGRSEKIIASASKKCKGMLRNHMSVDYKIAVRMLRAIKK